ncbi:MAG: hypothetical protein KAQ83_01305 [Nanoarchaeota archaeon]|nr:hypothetical protein [Nanoarchaeota archaeon]
MELNVILIMVIAILGYPIGRILAKISPEEMPTGKKYFHLIKSFMLAFILFFFLYYYQINIYLIVICSVIIFLLNLYVRINSLIFYPFFIVGLYLVQNNMFSLATISSLIFLFGLPAGSLGLKIKNKRK